MAARTTHRTTNSQEGLQNTKKENVDGEPRIRREPPRPRSLPELSDEHGSTTGVMPILRDPDDDSAKRDEDMPED